MRIRPRDVEDDILSAFMPQLPRCIVYLLYFCCIANRLICCSLCDMKEESGTKVKRDNNLQGDRSFNDLKNTLFLVSCLAQVVKEANHSARPVRRSYLYNILGRGKCE